MQDVKGLMISSEASIAAVVVVQIVVTAVPARRIEATSESARRCDIGTVHIGCDAARSTATFSQTLQADAVSENDGRSHEFALRLHNAAPFSVDCVTGIEAFSADVRAMRVVCQLSFSDGATWSQPVALSAADPIAFSGDTRIPSAQFQDVVLRVHMPTVLDQACTPIPLGVTVRAMTLESGKRALVPRKIVVRDRSLRSIPEGTVRVLSRLRWVIVAALLTLLIAPAAIALSTGNQFVVVNGKSMVPTYEVGDIVLIGPASSADFAPGRVVTVGRSSGEMYTHRIASITDGKAELKGDGNASVDPDTVTYDQLVGAVRGHIGSPLAPVLSYAQMLPVRISLAVVILALVLLPCGRRGPRAVARTDSVEEQASGHGESDPRCVVNARRSEPWRLVTAQEGSTK